MKIILASKSGVRKKILDKYNINNDVIVSNIDEDEVKKSLLAQKASPLIISAFLIKYANIQLNMVKDLLLSKNKYTNIEYDLNVFL